MVNLGSMPLNMSFAPRHKITIFGLSSRDQFSLAKPLLEVFPETLALMICNFRLYKVEFGR